MDEKLSWGAGSPPTGANTHSEPGQPQNHSLRVGGMRPSLVTDHRFVLGVFWPRSVESGMYVPRPAWAQPGPLTPGCKGYSQTAARGQPPLPLRGRAGPPWGLGGSWSREASQSQAPVAPPKAEGYQAEEP